MKRVFKYIACACALTAAFSCSKLNETPVFEDSKSFVAFSQTSYSVNEDADSLVIPVTVASPDPVKVTVAYSVADSTAKEGVNFKLADEAAVLVYDGTTRTQNIVINITNIVTTAEKSGYTGDLVFTVTLKSAGDLDLGFNKSCTVKIIDLDHPLAAILGTYECVAEDAGAGDVSWTMTLSKDDEDVTVVWIDYICPLAASNSSMKWAVYGTVSEDQTEIVIPCGQKPGALYAADDPFTFIWFDYDGGYNIEESGTVTMKQTSKGVFTTEDGMGFCSTSYVFNGGMLLKGTAVWTKK